MADFCGLQHWIGYRDGGHLAGFYVNWLNVHRGCLRHAFVIKYTLVNCHATYFDTIWMYMCMHTDSISMPIKAFVYVVLSYVFVIKFVLRI